MTNIARKTKRHPTDLTDEEWSGIEPLLPKPPKHGRKVSADLREMLNAICYLREAAVAGASCLLDKAAFRDFVMKIVRRSYKDSGFNVLPRRWAVERSVTEPIHTHR
jgi:transposase